MNKAFEELSDVEHDRIVNADETRVLSTYDNMLSYSEVAHGELLTIDCFPHRIRLWNEVMCSNGIEANPVAVDY